MQMSRTNMIAVTVGCMQSERETNLTIPNPKRLVQAGLTQDVSCQALKTNRYARQCMENEPACSRCLLENGCTSEHWYCTHLGHLLQQKLTVNLMLDKKHSCCNNKHQYPREAAD